MHLKIRAIQSHRMPFDSSLEILSEINSNPDDIIVFPEKFITTKIDAHGLKRILDVININNTIILGSLSYIDQNLYNRSFIIKNKQIIGWQDKINLYSKESIYYTPGSELKLFAVNGLKIGILVCYDLDFPDYPRFLFRQHCDIIFNPSLIRKDFHDEWHLYANARALENRIPVVSVNSISDDFLGDSIVVIPETCEGGVRINSITSRYNDIVADINTENYIDSREKRLAEENTMLDKVTKTHEL
ncbi:carbon-nitrogen hydrolase family protein [Ferroplasma sp.]|uniref:carbon-nitrogen hydrolase family protein n=1 Tax=Ferroplasma sp. TaxID=2591003 RepID=UPI00307D23D9